MSYPNVSGVYPHLALGAELGPPRSECGVGGLMPFAGRLWAVTYLSHTRRTGSGTGLYEIDSDFNITKRPESVPGTYATIRASEGQYVQLRLPSGEIRLVNRRCMATVGQVGNIEHENQSLGKAGRARHMGKRPEVRGVVMNPRDHPHGGGEGKSPTGMPPKTPWGQPAMGHRTRRNKKSGRLIATSRHRK